MTDIMQAQPADADATSASTAKPAGEAPADRYLRHIRNAVVTLAALAVLGVIVAVVMGIVLAAAVHGASPAGY